MNPFKNGSPWFPYRWFLVFATVVTLGMGCSDYYGWRALSFPGGNSPAGTYYGNHYYYHK
jgi:hypothetical protein